MSRVYMDHNAWTPLAPEAARAMAELLAAKPGNPSSIHAEGRLAREAIETARAAVAALVQVSREEVVFTSGGTEANHLAIIGGARHARRATGRAQIVTSPLEHPSVLSAVRSLVSEGFSIVEVPPDSEGRIEGAALERSIGSETALVTLSAANHETGTTYPVAAIAEIAHRAGAVYHCDAVQGCGKVGDLAAADLLSISAHKLYGPGGAGAVCGRAVVRKLDALVPGGHQERGLRAGTEPVATIAGFAAACALWSRVGPSREQAVRALRDELEARLLAIPGTRRFGPPPDQRTPGTLNVGFDGADGQLIVAGLDLEGVAASTGAACTSGSLAPSSVLLGMGFSRAVARSAVRFSLGWGSTAEEVRTVAATVPKIVARVRSAGL